MDNTYEAILQLLASLEIEVDLDRWNPSDKLVNRQPYIRIRNPWIEDARDSATILYADDSYQHNCKKIRRFLQDSGKARFKQELKDLLA